MNGLVKTAYRSKLFYPLDVKIVKSMNENHVRNDKATL